MADDLSYCGRLVKEQDRDRFLLSLFMKPEQREALWALFAFNHEIAKTREVVSETMLGQIRLQWWRDAIYKIYEEEDVPEHEVVRALARAVREYDLPQDPLYDLTYAREFDLEGVRPADIAGLVNYADFTTTPLLNLAVRITGDDPELELVQPVAVNYALAGLLRAVPFHARQRRCFLPEDLMERHGVREGDLYKGASGPALPELIAEIGAQIMTDIRPDNKFLKLSQALALIYWWQVKGVKYDVFHPRLAVPPAFRELRLLSHAFFIDCRL